MALQSMNKRSWVYTDDLEADWKITATAAIVSQGGAGTEKVGGKAVTNEANSWPRSWRPRKVYFTNPLTGVRKAVIAYDTTAPIWTTPGTTLTLNEGADVATYDATEIHLGERKRAATGQSS